MGFKQLSERQATEGIARMAVTTVVDSADPANMAAIMNTTTFLFITPYKDVGGTDGGTTLTKSFETTAYRLDQSESDLLLAITGHSLTIETTLGQTGDIESFALGWLAASATTIITTSEERKKGIAAKRTLPHRSLIVVEIDREEFLRAFYVRDVTNDGGDTAYAIAPGALHLLPLKMRAFSSTVAGEDLAFGFIMEEDGFGGVVNP